MLTRNPFVAVVATVIVGILTGWVIQAFFYDHVSWAWVLGGTAFSAVVAGSVTWRRREASSS